jgi:polysaccharide pyruvyl transferase WcaK-like protein
MTPVSVTNTIRILLVGETFSENLGDRVIADCLIFLITDGRQNVSVTTFDLSLGGGAASPQSMANPRRTPASWLRPVHRRIYSRLYKYRSYANELSYCRTSERYKASLREALDGANLVIIGGGQLVQDNSLLFPLKLLAVLQECHDRKIPIVLFSVGVGETWSSRGWNLCKALLCAPTVIKIYCRDKRSSEFLEHKLPMARSKMYTTFDAALMAKKAYHLTATTPRGIGIGLFSPDEVRMKKFNPGHPFCDIQWAKRFWMGLCAGLLERGKTIELFTNGAEIDQQFAVEIYQILIRSTQRLGKLRISERPLSADTFVKQISHYERIIAARMHANVVAESLGVPWIGFGWDTKVMAFAKMVGKERWVIERPRDAQSVLVHSETCFAERHMLRTMREVWTSRLKSDIGDALESSLPPFALSSEQFVPRGS